MDRSLRAFGSACLLAATSLSISGCTASVAAAFTSADATPIAGATSTPSSTPTPTPSPTPSLTPTPTPTPAPTPTPTPAPTPDPDPAPTGTTVSNIEQMSGWDSCDTCSGGGVVPYSMSQGLSYPQSGSTQFSIGHGDPWSHALWWRRLGNNAAISHFVLSLDQYIENPAASFGIEYNVNQLLNGLWYKFSTQCSFGDGFWQVWDSANKHWTRTSVPCTRPTTSTHVQLQMKYERVNGKCHFISISIDGKVYSVDVSFDPQPITGASGDFGVHYQLNGNATSDPYSVWVHNFSLNYW